MMHGQNLIINRPLAIDKNYLLSIIPHLIMGYQNKTFLSAEKINEKFAAQLEAQVSDFQDSGINRFPVVINIMGPIIKYSDCFYTGTQTILQILKSIEANDSISGVVFNFDTGGGMVSGTQELANYIFNMETPTIGYVNGYCCSAGMWLLAACKYKICNPYADEIGSIGVMISYQDFSALFAKYGATIYEIYAPQSSEKNLEYRELMKGNQTLYEEELSETADIFIADIKKFYGAKIKDDGHLFKGACYDVDEVIDMGLIDELGTLEYALSKF